MRSVTTAVLAARFGIWLSADMAMAQVGTLVASIVGDGIADAPDAANAARRLDRAGEPGHGGAAAIAARPRANPAATGKRGG